MIDVIDHSFVTTLQIQDIATTFRDKVQETRGLSGIVGRAALGWGWSFSTPERNDDPFAALDGQAAPAFSVIAHYGMRSSSQPVTNIGAFLQDGTSGFIRVDIWDEGSRRRVRIRRPKGMSIKAKGSLNAVLETYRAADRTIRVNEDRVRVQRP